MIRRWLAAILTLGSRSVRVAGNVVEQVLLLEDQPYVAVGIASDVSFERLDVLDNSVVPDPGQVNADGKPTGLTESVGLLIGEMPGEQNLYTIGEKVYLISATAILQWWPARSNRASAIRGNRLDAVGDGPAAVVTTDGSCTFAENHCAVPVDEQNAGGKSPIVELVVDTLVLSGNQVVGPRSDAMIAIEARVGGGTIKGDPAITALGNITAGRITVNGGPLQPPWEPLNIRTA
jgi:hypothetical protein